MISKLFWIVPVASVTALLFAWIFFKMLMKKSEGTDRMKEIAQYVREGAMAYITRQYKVVAIVFLFLVVFLTILAYMGVQNPFVPVAFLTGGIFSGLCGLPWNEDCNLCFCTNCSWCFTSSLNQALQIAFRSGAVMGLVVVGFALLDISAWFLLLNQGNFYS